ncbi:MAG: carbon monoxide dehydrogenase [Pelagibacteraceae bacterium]|nr:carbon monoxide dehydrogenase [Pelagibacteraceae bacterium]PHX88879.1 MAG: carbon monoxide dehydrogenase [Pelagibacteraceae bacterium]
MKLSGSYQINLIKQKVWQALNDPNILQKAIPGCEEFKKNSDTKFIAKATNKIGPFNASFTGEIELKDFDPPNSYKIVGSGNSPVGFASGEAWVRLENNQGGTKLIYEVQANVGGKIAQVGSRLIDMTAKKMADIFFGKFSELISPKDIENKDIENKVVKKNANKKIFYTIITIAILFSLYQLI